MKLKKMGFPGREFEEKRICDGCTRELEDGDYAVEYFSDTIWMGFDRVDLPQPAPHEIYCLYCYPNEIPVPHMGTNEGFSFLTMTNNPEDETYVLEETGVIKGSSRSSGIEWSPIDVLEDMHSTPVEVIPYAITPMHVFSLLRRSGVDLRGFILDGELKTPDEAKEEAKNLSNLYANYVHSPVDDPSML